MLAVLSVNTNPLRQPNSATLPLADEADPEPELGNRPYSATEIANGTFSFSQCK
ncbi:hypothetical protein CLV84_0017 [Neolewinella xylanilytica]|uniref:Uncharacterized protein n=1 Tax=Neolewinella xylanilytica TaxID=1514080 RepID=A0A2S6I6E1_9BACT|nr:hypothetical protein CLV84_0017 [Neolewinella xylanilytica]